MTIPYENDVTLLPHIFLVEFIFSLFSLCTTFKHVLFLGILVLLVDLFFKSGKSMKISSHDQTILYSWKME
jgi:hypothetical protein